MDREMNFWEAVRALTYSEMLDVAAQLRDTCDPDDFKLNDANDWGKVLHGAMTGYDSEMKDAISRKDLSRWLAAWSVDQRSVGNGKPEYEARASALADAAREVLYCDVTDLRGFVQADGTYRPPEPVKAA